MKSWRYVTHRPHWVPADLRIDAAGNTRPGFICTHQLENGMGECGGNVLQKEDVITWLDLHCCIVRNGHRYKRKIFRKGWKKR